MKNNLVAKIIISSIKTLSKRANLYLIIFFVSISFFFTASATSKDFLPLPKYKPAVKNNYNFEITNKNFSILSHNDAMKYINIFHFQKLGLWHLADQEIKKLGNNILMGHVLFQRYMHPTSYRSSFTELSNWLENYGDHPGARRIYRLANRRKPYKSKKPLSPKILGFNDLKKSYTKKNENSETLYLNKANKKKSKINRRKTKAFVKKIKQQIKRDILTTSEEQVREKSKSILNVVETDQLLWEIGARWYFRGDNDVQAFKLSSEAAKRSRKKVEIADWTAGLAAWRMGKAKEAQKYFEALAKSSSASSWNVAAGAFWAARANLANNNPQKVKYWLEVGSKHKRTFYGLLCRKLLAKNINISSTTPQVTKTDITILKKVPGILRALALHQTGEKFLADQEAKQLISSANNLESTALLNISSKLKLPSTTIKLALDNLEFFSPYYDSTAYPMPEWLLQDEREIDKALIFAFVRQESRFNSHARSPAGAIGLMQLMPRTASFVARDKSLRRNKKYKLYEPKLNLELGQKYLKILMKDENVGRNLFFLTAAYNAGPSKLGKWLKNINYNNDPLLFIESIPAKETRIFVERVLTNLWIYRNKLGQENPSLNDAAEGKWPSYFSMDENIKVTSRSF